MRVAGWLLSVVCFVQVAGAEAPSTVGVLGDPDHLAIRSATTFRAEEIKDALRFDATYQLAADSTGPLDEYLKTVERLILAGYRNAGFPDVKVAACVDPKSHDVAVNVTEGPRYAAGEIRIRGNKKIPRASLVGRLTKPHPPKDAVALSCKEQRGETSICWANSNGEDVEPYVPVWESGKPPHFFTGAEADSALHRAIAAVLEDLGYFFAKFSVDVAVDRATKKAHLVIDIAEEGEPCVLGGVNITGNKMNSREDVLKYLEFRAGVPATRDEQARLESKLWHSGRFIKSSVTLYRPATAGDQATMWINLLELDRAPPLAKPLSREESVLLKGRSHLANTDSWQGDFVIQCESSDGSGALVFSPTHGVFLDVKSSGKPPQKPFECVAVVSPTEMGFYRIPARSRLTLGLPAGQLYGNVGLRLDESGNLSEPETGKLIFGIGMNPYRHTSGMPFDLVMTLDPVWFVDMANRPNTKCTIQEGVLTVATPEKVWRIDEATGRLIDIVETYVSEEEAKDVQPNARAASAKQPTEGIKSVIRSSFVRGEFRRRVDANRVSTADFKNGYDARRPMSSVLTFLCEEDWIWQWLGGTKNEKACRLIRRMLDQDVCEPFEKGTSERLAYYQSAGASGEREDFEIPIRTAVEQSLKRDIASRNWQGFMAARALTAPGSWPEVLTRQMLMISVGRGESTSAELKKVYSSDKTGPLFFAATGSLFQSWNPSMAMLMASRGLERLSLGDFRKEYAVFLAPQGPMGQCARRIVAFLRTLDASEAESLCTLFPNEKSAALFRVWMQGLRQNREQPTDQALMALLDAIWQGGLCDYVKTVLEMTRNAAATCANRQDMDKLIAEATEAIRIDSRWSIAYHYRAYAYGSKNELDKALADYNTAIRLDPKNARAYCGRASIYQQKGSRANLAGVSKAPPLGKEIDFGITFDPNKKADGVEKTAATAITGTETAHGLEIVDKDFLALAIADYTEAIRLDPTLLDAYDNRSLLHLAKGNLSEANADIAQAKRFREQGGKVK
jgi:tetratricopeptide (TPR) repeat protein